MEEDMNSQLPAEELEKHLVDTLKKKSEFDNIYNRWEKSNNMRQWIAEKKKSLSIKEEERKKDEKKGDDDKKDEEKKEDNKEEEKKEEKKKEQEEEVISTSAAPEEKKAEEQKDKERPDYEVELEKIIDKILEKADFLVKMNIPRVWGKAARKGEGSLLLVTPSQSEGLNAERMDWVERLKNWKSRLTSKGAIKDYSQASAEIYNSSASSVLACLQSPISAQY